MNAVMSIDYETASDIDLKKSGAYVYFAHHSTEVRCAGFTFDGVTVKSWVPGDKPPQELQDHIRNGGLVSGWNVGFEKLCFEHIMTPLFGWELPALEQYDDTMAMAAGMNLPLGLDQAAAAIGLSERKDKAGKEVMIELSVPGPATPEKMAQLLAYNRQDCIVEYMMRQTLIELSDLERQLYHLDQVINDRGVMLDMKLVAKMQQIIADEQIRLNAKLVRSTNGELHSVGQDKAIRKWVCDHGVYTTSVDAPTTLNLLDGPLPDHVRRVLEIRQEGGKARFSKGKLDAATACVCTDGRARGLLQFQGANSGRWAGRLLGPQNFPRPTGWVKDAELALPWLMTGSAEKVEFAYGWPLRAISDCLRSIIVAAPKHDLIAGDFSSVESRLLGWVADERWKVAAYEAHDAGVGPGIYELMGSQIYNVPVEEIGEKDPRRQVAKTAELSMGYAGGVTALTKMARNYNVSMAPALPALLASAPAERIEKAERRYADCFKRSDSSADILTKDAWMASELTKHAWRATNPNSVEFWRELEEAARDAVENPGMQFDARQGIAFRMVRGALWQRLPSGRALCYPAARISFREVPWADKTLPPEQREKRRTVVAYVQDNKKWLPEPLYGGRLCAYTIQGTARDLLAAAMLRLEAAGYPLVLSVHDEAVAEVPEGFGSLDAFCAIMADNPSWALGLPTVAKGYRAQRFKKG